MRLAIFVAGFAAVSLAAQRGLDGIARILWSVIGSFWAALVFWVAGIPLAVRSGGLPGTGAYGPPFAPGGFAFFSQLLPVVSVAMIIGIVTGLGGWALHSVRGPVPAAGGVPAAVGPPGGPGGLDGPGGSPGGPSSELSGDQGGGPAASRGGEPGETGPSPARSGRYAGARADPDRDRQIWGPPR